MNLLRRTNYVPLPEVQDYSTRIEWGELGLPVGFDESQIGINIKRLEKIARTGGLGTVAIYGYRGETSDAAPSIVGMSGVNTAAAGGRKAARKVKLGHGSGGESSDDVFLEDYYEYPVNVGINTAEIDSRIRDDGERWPRRLMDPYARAHYLDEALRIGMLEAVGRRQFTFTRKFMTGLSLVGLATYATHGITSDEMFRALRDMPENNVLFAALSYLFYRLKPSERKWSYFFGIQFDRLAIVHGLARTRRLAKVIDTPAQPKVPT